MNTSNSGRKQLYRSRDVVPDVKLVGFSNYTRNAFMFVETTRELMWWYCKVWGQAQSVLFVFVRVSFSVYLQLILKEAVHFCDLDNWNRNFLGLELRRDGSFQATPHAVIRKTRNWAVTSSCSGFHIYKCLPVWVVLLCNCRYIMQLGMRLQECVNPQSPVSAMELVTTCTTRVQHTLLKNINFTPLFFPFSTDRFNEFLYHDTKQ